MNNNYRVDVFYKPEKSTTVYHYPVEFPEYWLAKVYADAIKCECDVETVYLLERMSDNAFDIFEVIKR